MKRLFESSVARANVNRDHINVSNDGGPHEAKGWELWCVSVQHVGRNPIGTLGVTKFFADANDPQPHQKLTTTMKDNKLECRHGLLKCCSRFG